jgi:hypothetical protein
VDVSGGRIAVLFDWSSVKKITEEDDWLIGNGSKDMTGFTNVIVTQQTAPGVTNTVYLSHLSKESADRAAFAIQYLKDQCGLKSDTGF